jgi:hypothetical protein
MSKVTSRFRDGWGVMAPAWRFNLALFRFFFRISGLTLSLCSVFMVKSIFTDSGAASRAI